MNKMIAEEVINNARHLSGEVSELANIIKKGCEGDELKTFNYNIGVILADLFDKIMIPIFREYPDLIPSDMDFLKGKLTK
jgi:hypothetical protein